MNETTDNQALFCSIIQSVLSQRKSVLIIDRDTSYNISACNELCSVEN